MTTAADSRELARLASIRKYLASARAVNDRYIAEGVNRAAAAGCEYQNQLIDQLLDLAGPTPAPEGDAA